jgi:hypothetical protein
MRGDLCLLLLLLLLRCRVGHAMVAVGSRLLVLGGRASPAKPLGDCWLLDTAGGGAGAAALRWQPLEAEVEGGGPWPGRFRHSAVHLAGPQVGPAALAR